MIRSEEETEHMGGFVEVNDRLSIKRPLTYQ